jgi:CheY-like chemotaxis protein
MVYGFVRQSGGNVVVESTPGIGTTVMLYLPKAAPALIAEAAPAPKPAKTTGTERILLVEDDEAIRAVTAEFLGSLGYHVTSARNGPEAVQILASGEEFDLLFTDIGMPQGMNGVELAREARRLNNAIKILLTSGYAGDVLDRNRAAREFPMIPKPFLGSQLAQSIRSVLQES